jgi:hypothetical protein
VIRWFIWWLLGRRIRVTVPRRVVVAHSLDSGHTYIFVAHPWQNAQLKRALLRWEENRDLDWTEFDSEQVLEAWNGEECRQGVSGKRGDA